MQVQPYQIPDDRGYELGLVVLYTASGVTHLRTGVEAARHLQREAKAALKMERKRRRGWLR